MSYQKISFKETIFLTIILIALLYGINLISIKNYELKIAFTIITYLSLILYTNKYRVDSIMSGIFLIEKYTKLIFLVPIIAISLFSLIYSMGVLLNALVYGDAFFINLMTYTRGFKTAIFVLLVFPLLEELFFRKSILRGLINLYSNWKSIVVSSIMFSVAHYFSETGLIAAFLASIVLGWIYIYYRSFLIVLLVHVVYNSLFFFVTPQVNKYLVVMELHEVFVIFTSIWVVSILTILSCFYLLNSKRENEAGKT